jgi:hypothetical protein
MSKKDYTNLKVNRLTFIKATNKKSGGKIVWELLCECGNITYAIVYKVTSGRTKSCGCYALQVASKIATKRGLANRKYPPIISSARRVWEYYKDGCDFETFFKLSQLSCDYCGRKPYRIFNIGSKQRKSECTSDFQKTEGNFIYNGLDRIDSSKTHTPDNVVPCCWDCNDMKKDRTRDEFISHIKRIHTHLTP